MVGKTSKATRSALACKAVLKAKREAQARHGMASLNTGELLFAECPENTQ